MARRTGRVKIERRGSRPHPDSGQSLLDQATNLVMHYGPRAAGAGASWAAGEGLMSLIEDFFNNRRPGGGGFEDTGWSGSDRYRPTGMDGPMLAARVPGPMADYPVEPSDLEDIAWEGGAPDWGTVQPKDLRDYSWDPDYGYPNMNAERIKGTDPRVRDVVDKIGRGYRPNDRISEDNAREAAGEIPSDQEVNDAFAEWLRQQTGENMVGADMLSYHPALDPRTWFQGVEGGPTPEQGGAISLLDLLPVFARMAVG